MLMQVLNQTKLAPRPYQERIVNKVVNYFRDGLSSVMIESPTGSGKTSMALLSCRLLQEYIPDLVVGWVAMRRNLLKQAQEENINKNIGVRNIHYVSMFEKAPLDLLRAKTNSDNVLLVCDEAQHDAASSMTHLHTLIEPKYILGMTATPFRTDRMKLCFQKVIKDAGIHQLIQDGFLSRYDHYTIPAWTVEHISARYLAEPERWGKSIFYMKNVQQCYALQDALVKGGASVDVVTGNTDWESQLLDFKEGRTTCLINCMKLTEGFDEPSIETAWVRDSVKGCTIQMGGRVFRLHSDLPVKKVVQSTETGWPFLRTALSDMQYVWQQDKWLSLKVNPKIKTVNDNARLAILQTEVKLPAFLVKQQAKNRPSRFPPAPDAG